MAIERRRGTRCGGLHATLRPASAAPAWIPWALAIGFAGVAAFRLVPAPVRSSPPRRRRRGPRAPSCCCPTASSSILICLDRAISPDSHRIAFVGNRQRGVRQVYIKCRDLSPGRKHAANRSNTDGAILFAVWRSESGQPCRFALYGHRRGQIAAAAHRETAPPRILTSGVDVVRRPPLDVPRQDPLRPDDEALVDSRLGGPRHGLRGGRRVR